VTLASDRHAEFITSCTVCPSRTRASRKTRAKTENFRKNVIILDLRFGPRFDSRQGGKIVLHNVQIGSGVHSASYTRATRGSIPRRKAAGDVKLTTHLHLVPRSRMMDLYLYSPIRLHDAYAQYGCFIPRQTGRLTVGRNIRLRLSSEQNRSDQNTQRLEWRHIRSEWGRW
jgi:hypothetical protein